MNIKHMFARLTTFVTGGWVQFTAIVMLMVYAYISLQIRYVNANEIARLREEVARAERVYRSGLDALDLRVQALEATTYVDVLAELQKRPVQNRAAIEAWMKNRDSITNERLRALELWRYRVEEKQ